MSNPMTTPLPSNEKQRRHILVVEDNVALRYTLAEWLRMSDYVVLEAATADEALVVLQSSLTVDVVVTDVHMPGSMDGLTLANHISTTFPAIKFIIVSGEVERHKLAKDAVFFRKPYDLKQITEHIAKMLPESEPD
jgi:CheY-like chemotaxis protein